MVLDCIDSINVLSSLLCMFMKEHLNNTFSLKEKFFFQIKRITL